MSPRLTRLSYIVFSLTILLCPATPSLDKIRSDSASQENALALHSTAFNRIYQGGVISFATLAFVLGILDRPTLAQVPAPAGAAPSAQIAATPPWQFTEAWLVTDFLSSARRLHVRVATTNDLTWGELQSWITFNVRPLDNNFANREIGLARDPGRIVTRLEWHLFWRRLLNEVLDPKYNYIVYGWAYDGRLQVGHILERDVWTSPMGNRVQVRILNPLVGETGNASADYILFPKSFDEKDPIRGDLIERVHLLWDEGWFKSKSNWRPKFVTRAPSRENLSELRDWLARCLVGLESDIEAGRRIFQEAKRTEELVHADLDFYLRAIYAHPSYSMDLDQWYAALRDHVYPPDWEKRLAERNIVFNNLALPEKRSFIDQELEYLGQLLTLKRAEQSVFAWLKFNLADDPVHAAATIAVRERLSLYILGKKTSSLEDWILALIQRLSQGLDDPNLSNSAREARLRENIQKLNLEFKTAARNISQEEFRFTGERATSVGDILFEPVRRLDLLMPRIPTPPPSRRRSPRQSLFRRSA